MIAMSRKVKLTTHICRNRGIISIYFLLLCELEFSQIMFPFKFCGKFLPDVAGIFLGPSILSEFLPVSISVTCLAHHRPNRRDTWRHVALDLLRVPNLAQHSYLQVRKNYAFSRYLIWMNRQLTFLFGLGFDFIFLLFHRSEWSKWHWSEHLFLWTYVHICIWFSTLFFIFR